MAHVNNSRYWFDKVRFENEHGGDVICWQTLAEYNSRKFRTNYHVHGRSLLSEEKNELIRLFPEEAGAGTMCAV